MDVNWNEINTIIQASSSQSSLIQMDKMTKADHQKVSFLLNDAFRFPDHQAAVAQSGEQLRTYLSETYSGLSAESIDRIVNTFCLINR